MVAAVVEILGVPENRWMVVPTVVVRMLGRIMARARLREYRNSKKLVLNPTIRKEIKDCLIPAPKPAARPALALARKT